MQQRVAKINCQIYCLLNTLVLSYDILDGQVSGHVSNKMLIHTFNLMKFKFYVATFSKHLNAPL